MISTTEIQFTNSTGELLSPVLLAIRSTGFFEAYVFIPTMTVLAIALFLRLKRKIQLNETFESTDGVLKRRVFFSGYFALCFLATNATAVAFKTFIVQELDYEQAHWFIPYVAPLHFYITSVVGTHLWLVWTNRGDTLSAWACAYVQLGLVGGYAIAGHRLLNEPFDLTDVTSGASGIYLFVFFAVLNWDLVRRLIRSPETDVRSEIPDFKMR